MKNYLQAPAVAIRSFISKITPAEELGSVFSILAALEACLPFMTSPIFTLVYKKTIDYFPGAVMLISAILFVLIIINLSVVYGLVRKGIPTVEYIQQNPTGNEERTENEDHSIS